MDKIEKIRQEIERRKGYISVTHFAEDLLSLIDSLQQEQPVEGLEEEQTCKGFEEEFRRFIKKEKEKEPDGSLPYYGDYGIYRIARHFAEWGKNNLK